MGSSRFAGTCAVLVTAALLSGLLTPFASGLVCIGDAQAASCCRPEARTAQALAMESGHCDCCIAVDAVPTRLVSSPQHGASVAVSVPSAELWPAMARIPRPIGDHADARFSSLRSTVLLI
jgi:hypothetical protein